MRFIFNQQNRHQPAGRPFASGRLVLGLALLGLVASYCVLSFVRSGEARAVNGATIESFDFGLKMGRHRIELGKDTATTFRAGMIRVQGVGEQEAAAPIGVAALQAGQVRPLSMSADDFNFDGMQDLAIGYASNAGGLITLRHGNLEAIAPKSPEVLAGLREGRYPSPFQNQVDTYAIPENPDFIATGDFDADGNPDVIAGAHFGHYLYFLSGDGAGGMKSLQTIGLAGMITSMTRGHFNEDAGSRLAVGVMTTEGARVVVYDDTVKGVKGEPTSFALPAAAEALAIDNVDGDTAGDLIAGAANHVVIIHGRNPAEPSANRNVIERFEVPYNISAVAAGNFVFDREGKSKLALLAGDGMVHFLAPGTLDTRTFTHDEIETMRKRKMAIRRGEADDDSFVTLINSMVHHSAKRGGWQEIESHSTGAIPTGGNAQALMVKTADAGALLDKLVALEPVNNKVELIDYDDTIRAASLGQPEGTAAIDSLDLDGAPAALVTMRLSTDGRRGSVILQANQAEPILEVPTANTWNVNSNADLVDDNPGNGVCHTSTNVCTLRAAMMESSYRGSSNTINLQTTTYTLSRNGDFSGGPDDEFDAAGDDQTGGDLDVVDLVSICAFLGGCPGINLGPTALTSVSVVGTGTANSILAMGTMSTVHMVNKDRILEVNDFADPQFPTDLVMTNLTMQNGSAPNWNTTGANFYHEPGGAIQFDGTKSQAPSAGPTATLTLTTVNITSNTAAGQGGGVFINWGSGLIQTGSLFTSNTTTFGSGGGLSYNGGNINLTQTLTITGSTFGGAGNGNTAPDLTFGNGAGVNTNGSTGVTINGNSVISNNVAGNLGGGVSFANSPVVAVTSSTISNNTAKGNGGGIYSSIRNAITNAASTATYTTATVTGNTADSDNNGAGDGGGIYSLFGTTILQTTSHVDGNTANNGGGVFTTWNGQTNDLPASVTVNTSSTIGQTGVGNNAKNHGGGIAIDVGGNSATTPKTGTVTLTGVTLKANTANSDNTGGGDGGGIYDNGNDANFKINLSLDGATIDSNVANSGGGGGTGDGMFLNTGTVNGANTVSFNGDDTLNINGGTFTSTSGTLNLAGNFTRASAGTFTHNSGTVNFNGTVAQNINGTATSETFNNFIVNKTGTLATGGSTTSITTNDLTMTAGTFTAPATLSINGNALLSAGTLTAGATINSLGNWTNNGGTFTAGSGIVNFNSTTADQIINGTAASQTFNNVNVNKTGRVLNTGGSTATVVTNNLTVTAGTFTAPATLDINGGMTFSGGTLTAGANITAAGDWTNNTGTFTPGSGTVTFDGGGAQNLNGLASTQTFNNIAVNKGGATLTGGGSTATLTINGGITLTAGAFAAGTITSIGMTSGNWTNNGGTFTPGTSIVTFSNASGAQSINGSASAQTFNSITMNKTGQTLNVAGSTATLNLNGTMTLTAGNFNVNTASNVNVAGDWSVASAATFTPGSGTNTVTFNGGGAQTLGGTATTQAFNNFTVNKGGGTLGGGGSLGTLTINKDFTISAGTFAPGATLLTINESGGNWSNSGTFTAGSGTVIFNANAAAQSLSGSTTFNNLTINHTGAGNVDASGSTLAVGGLLRIQSGTFISASTFNNVTIESGQTLQGTNATMMNVSGNWTNNGGTFTPSGNTVNFNGSAAQVIGGTAATQTFNNLTVNKPLLALSAGGSTNAIIVNDLTMTQGTFTAPATLTINGNTLLTAGTLTAGATINAAGNWTNNGSAFTAGAGAVNLNGGAAQMIGGTAATTFNNLTNSNANGVAMNNDNTVNGILLLTSSDITVAATKTLTQPAAGSSSGTFDVNGRIQRNSFVSGGAALSFGNPFNTIQVTAGTAPANIVVDLARAVPGGAQGFPSAVQRTYTITPSTSAFTATIRLHYLTTELNGNDPTLLNLWRFDSGINQWRPNPATSRDCAAGCTTNNSNFWAERTGVTQFSPWTLNSTTSPSAAPADISGRITDAKGVGLGGTLIQLSGPVARTVFADKNGYYHFDGLDTGQFYTVTPSLANYHFSPASRSFSLLGNMTDAGFTGIADKGPTGKVP